MKNPTLYGIGNPIIDLNFRVSDAELSRLGYAKGIMTLIEPEAQKALLAGLGREPDSFAAGGDCPNMMVTASLLGTSTALSGKIGQDDFGTRYQKRLGETGVSSYLTSGPGTTASSIIMVSPDGERTMCTCLGACQSYKPEDFDQTVLAKAHALVITGYFWDTPNQKSAVLEALASAHKLGKMVVFDAADPFAVGRSKEDFLKLLNEHTDIVFANLEEAKALTGGTTALDCAKSLATMVPCGAVKTGADGALVFLHGQIQAIPAWKAKQVADTTGAGDSFAAAFLHGLFQKMQGDNPLSLDAITMEDLVRAGRMASCVAALVISRTGPQLTAEELPALQALLKEI